MATIKRFEDLECWKNARELCRMVYVFISREPFSKDYALRNQLNSSSGSVMDNIAEGFERSGNREFIQFLSIAKGSAGESRSQLYRALDRNLISEIEFQSAFKIVELTSNTIQGLMSYLNQSDFKGSKFVAKEEEIKYGNGKTLNFEP